jgi:hypothetical protein
MDVLRILNGRRSPLGSKFELRLSQESNGFDDSPTEQGHVPNRWQYTFSFLEIKIDRPREGYGIDHYQSFSRFQQRSFQAPKI